jgi:beta-lactamase regulating signal transducer with metallopeptidase domain
MIDTLASTFAEALLASTLLMLLVLGIRRPVARHFGAHAAYALWALPALRLLLPPLPGIRTPIDHLLALSAAPALPLPAAAGGAGTLTPVPAPTVSVAAVSPDWPHVLMVVWFAGVALWMLWQTWRYQRFLASALARATLLMRTEAADVLVSDAVAGPLATGIRHPRIFVPVDFHSRYAPAERALALRHEGAHHARGDILANVAGLAVLALHWWNPIAHIAWRAFRADQEVACDATVLAGANADDRHNYGRAMLKSAASSVPVAASAMNAKTQLKERITMMKHHDLPVGRRLWGVAGTAAIIVGGLVLTAAGAPPTPAAVPAPPMAPAPVATLAPPAPPAPPSAVAAPAPPAAPTRQIRTLIIKDGKVIENSNGTAAVIAIPDDAKAGDKTGRKTRQIVMIRHGDGPADADIDAMLGDGTADAGDKVVRKIIVKCAPETGDASGTTGCGKLDLAAINPDIRESLAVARKSIEASAGLSDAQRRAALEGLDEALREMSEPAKGTPTRGQ